MTYVKPGRAAAAEMPMGQRAAQAGVGLCQACRHPVRLHGDLGCATGECFCSSTGTELRSGVVAAPAPIVPPSVAELERLDARCTCGHVRTGHRVTGSHVPCKVAGCRCRAFVVGPEVPDAPVAPPAEPAPPPPAAAAPAPAVASAAPPGPVRESPAPRPVVDLPPWLPGTGVPPAPLVVAATAEEADEIIAAVKAKVAAKRPRHTSARPAPACAPGLDAVVGERDAVEEVAAVPPAVATVHAATADVRFGPLPPTVQATPAPLDLTPFLGAALYYYPAWFCKGCLQRRHNPGVHCRRPLLPVYVVIAPRSTA